MIDITPVVTYRNQLLRPGAKRKAHKAVLAGLKDAVRFWWKTYLPRHFERGAVQRYKYEPRSRGYLVRRRKAKGHSDPLTFTRTMRRMLSTGIRVTGSLGKGVKGRMRGPRHAFIQKSGKATNQPDKVRELKATVKEEATQMARVLDERSTAELNRPDPVERVRP